MKLTFRYNSMLNFIQVSFCFLLFLGFWLRLRLGSVIGLGFKVRVWGLSLTYSHFPTDVSFPLTLPLLQRLKFLLMYSIGQKSVKDLAK